jgi:poly(3-hydroxyalkanoate) depolymerase
MDVREELDDVRFVDVDGLRLRVSIRDGAAPVPPLLLCNGIGAPLELLEPFRVALGDRPTISFDVPGAGRSDVPRRPPTLSEFARTTRAMLDGLGLDRVDVLGISWGGMLAQQLARSDARRVRRLVLVATAAGGAAVPGTPRAMWALADTRRYNDPEHLMKIAPILYGPEIAEDPSFLDKQAEIRKKVAPSKKGYLYQQLALRGFASALWLRQLRQPTLVIHGNADPIVPEVNAHILARLIPDARAKIVARGGHLCLLTKPALCARWVNDFLAA